MTGPTKTAAPVTLTPSRPRGKRIRYRLEAGAVRAAAALIPLLPREAVYLLGGAAGLLGWAVDSRGRKTGMENLRAAFGDRYTETERRRLLRTCYRVFARTFLDLFWSPRLNTKNWARYYTYEFAHPEAREVLEKNNCLYITAHLGGFELLGVAKALRGQGSMTIAENFKNPPLTEIFRDLRSGGGLQPIIPQEGAVLRILKHLRRGGSAVALADLTVSPEQNATLIRSFGMLSSVSYSHCALAQRTGVPILLFYFLPSGDGRWTVRFLKPLRVGEHDDLQACAQHCWDVLEPVIREHPEQWLWMYKHWRYLPENTAPASYPKYARRHRMFDALQRTVFAERGGSPQP